ncbi:MAG: hypothetical protein NTV94_13785 [Planctomycetota bacterium]|nr:hypothetical protein [Planctomycetota bacterium]
MLPTPWRSSPFPGHLPVPAQLHPDEVDYLHWLTSTQLHGVGRIVELGCFLGGSTFALASGLRLAKLHAAGKIITHDSFVMPRGITDITTRYSAGDCFRPLFESNLRDHLDLLDIREGWLPADADAARAREVYPEQEPVELLFIDCAKQWPVHTLREHFIPLHDVDGATLAFRYLGGIERSLDQLWSHKSLETDSLPELWRAIEDHFAPLGEGVRLGILLAAARHFAAAGRTDWCAAAMLRWRAAFDECAPASWKRPALELWTSAISSLLRPLADPNCPEVHALGELRIWGQERLDQDQVQSRHAGVDVIAWDRTAAALSTQGVRQVALYGAGRHTRDLLASGWPHDRLVVRAILDDHMAGTQVMGIPVLAPDAKPAGVDTVLISSRQHEATLASAAARVLDSEVRIVRVYADQSTALPALAA